MDQGLPQYWTYLTLLVFATAMFHLLLVWPRPQTEIFWKWIDYVWFGYSIFAIVSAVAQLREIQAPVALANDAWNFKVSLFIENTKKEYEIGCGYGRRDQEGCDWFDKVITTITKAGDSASAWADLTIPSSSNIVHLTFKNDATDINFRVDDLKANARNHNYLEKIKEDRDSLIFLLVALWLLPFALALRLTKVTAEIILTRKKRNAE